MHKHSELFLGPSDILPTLQCSEDSLNNTVHAWKELMSKSRKKRKEKQKEEGGRN
jgi:hypothetical protein